MVFAYAFSASAYLILGLIMLIRDTRALANRALFGFSICLAIWCLADFGMLVGSGRAWETWKRLAYFGAASYAPCALLFAADLVRRSGTARFRWRFAIVLLPYLALEAGNLGFGLIAPDRPESPWFIAHHALTNFYNFTCLFFIARWGWRSTFHRERRQAAVIVLGALLCMGITVPLDWYCAQRGAPSPSSSLVLIWLCMAVLAVHRYGVHRLMPGPLGGELLRKAGGARFLMDIDGLISFAGPGCANAFGLGPAGTCLFDQMENADFLRDRFERAAEGRNEDHPFLNVLIKSPGRPRPALLGFSPIRDSWSQCAGFLCELLAPETPQRLAEQYGLSPREGDILSSLLSGLSQQQTADELFLSLPTVKTHTAHIYDKLGISSRAELLALLGQGQVSR